MRAIQLICAAAMTLLLSSCAQQNSVYGLRGSPKVVKLDELWLGKAYHSAYGALADVRCVTGVTRHVESGENLIVKLGEDLELKELAFALGGDISFAASNAFLYGGIKGLASKANASSEFVANRYISLSLDGPSVYLSPLSYELTPYALRKFTQNEKSLKSFCGDQFVSAIKLGASLNVSIEAEFLKAEDRKLYGAEVIVKAGLPAINLGFSAGGGGSKVTEKLSQSVIIKITVNQVGGDPGKLMNVLPSSMTVCHLDQIDPCHEFLNAILEYAQGSFKEQFHTPEDYAVISFKKERYVDSLLNSYFEADDRISMRNLRMLMDKMRIDLAQISQFIKRSHELLTVFRSFWSDQKVTNLQQIQNDLEQNALEIEKTIRKCIQGETYSGCAGDYKRMQDLLVHVEHQELDPGYLTKEYTQQCDFLVAQAVELGLINASHAVMYDELGWAPVIDWSNKGEPKLLYWSDCLTVIANPGS